jgi:hypothetical protein
MPKISQTYAGTYLNAAELTPLGQHRRAIVHGAAVEEIGQGERKEAKIVLSLTTPKGVAWPKDVVLNKTNALQLAGGYGDETDDWVGKSIEIWAENVMFQGKIVPGIKIQPVKLALPGAATGLPRASGDGVQHPAAATTPPADSGAGDMG